MIEKLKNIDRETYNRLKNSGMFWELHPEATGNWTIDSGGIRSSYNWLKEPEYKNLTILDSDGWDRKNYEESMTELIPREEFDKRVSLSTISWPLADLLAYANFGKDKNLVEFTD